MYKDKEERNFRIKIILSAVGLLVAVTLMIVINFLGEDLIWVFYPSLLAGMLFGVGTCIYLSDAWDPELLTMKKKGEDSKKTIPWVWGPPLGVLVGNIIASFFGNGVRNMLMGLFFGWFYLTVIFSIVQVWRYRPK